MTKTPSILGLICARGGSKGVPGKNKKHLHGKPLIAYTIESALACTLLDQVLVSTDSPEIQTIAIESGANAPFLRPDELAQDNSKQIDAIIHAINYAEKQRQAPYDYICLLQPTCPLRTAEDITGTLELIVSTQSDSAIAITEVGGRHPMTLYTQDENTIVTPYLEAADTAGVQRQDFQDIYWRSGSVYAMKRDLVIEDRDLYGAKTCGYIIPEERAFNIDSPFDWTLCEAYMQQQKTNKA